MMRISRTSSSSSLTRGPPPTGRRDRVQRLPFPLLALTGCVDLSVNTSVVGGTPAVLSTVPVLLSLSSRPEGSHLRALPEPYVNLSIHTAPDVRPFP